MAGDELKQETIPDGNSVERELVIPAPVEEVWEAVTGDGWLADEVKLDLIPGGDASFKSGDGIRTGWVEEVTPPGAAEDAARLVYWWEGNGGQTSRVVLILEPADEDATRLRVSETRPLEVLDVRGIPLPGSGSASHGPALLAVA